MNTSNLKMIWAIIDIAITLVIGCCTYYEESLIGFPDGYLLPTKFDTFIYYSVCDLLIG
ncbi:hypothetical protein [uncultured Formosa sp.]|uniref:hypothetical protein n=1 Tax=uncultured Formosa sp. TaxID=255435 RepID=UPI0026164904|nr:hypothetical protein [uncultured Formosa sp.]